jgi:hypothetical protein
VPRAVATDPDIAIQVGRSPATPTACRARGAAYRWVGGRDDPDAVAAGDA